MRPAVEGLGGRIESAYYAFGEHDIILTVEMPDNTKAAAMALAVGAGGAVSAYTTTVLLTPEEAVQAMSEAAESVYKPATGWDSSNSGKTDPASIPPSAAEPADGGPLTNRALMDAAASTQGARRHVAGRRSLQAWLSHKSATAAVSLSIYPTTRRRPH